jgi:protein phosphatase
MSLEKPLEPRLTRHRQSRLADVCGVSDVGRRRRNNEDTIGWDAEYGLAVVADGMGGNNAGEVASATVVRTVKSDLRAAMRLGGGDSDRVAMSRLCTEVVRRANQRVLAAAMRDPKLQGMGTTIAMLLVSDRFVTLAHAGDSRVYRLRAERFECLTRDHSMISDLVQRGSLSEEEARTSNHRNVLTRAIGLGSDLVVDVAQHDIHPGDTFLLCSDGLTGAVSDPELAALLGRDEDLADACRAAVDLANERGGHDNISIVLARLA